MLILLLSFVHLIVQLESTLTQLLNFANLVSHLVLHVTHHLLPVVWLVYNHISFLVDLATRLTTAPSIHLLIFKANIVNYVILHAQHVMALYLLTVPLVFQLCSYQIQLVLLLVQMVNSQTLTLIFAQIVTFLALLVKVEVQPAV